LAPGCQIQKLPKRIGKEKGPPEALFKCLVNRDYYFYGFPTQGVRSYRTNEEKEILGLMYVRQLITKGDN